MKSILNTLKISNKDYDLETGFFWVEFSNDKSLQCCLKQHGNDDSYYFKKEIELDNNGYSDGLSGENNAWAADGQEWGHINDFLIAQAREIGIAIIA